MGLFRHRRDLDLLPITELHGEFAERPDAKDLLSEADDYLTQREHEYAESASRLNTPGDPHSTTMS